ncbi:unnamed protein product [Leptidea sinapis]|uniref:Uncharacterized protein n=1 Tax=Leptidea sinapis TaxID=189913 RepID=A0A5E4QET6_9NEOP|nr:unnamed protein product [Leptidea sinapis]
MNLILYRWLRTTLFSKGNRLAILLSQVIHIHCSGIHIANHLSKDPVKLRLLNIRQKCFFEGKSVYVWKSDGDDSDCCDKNSSEDELPLHMILRFDLKLDIVETQVERNPEVNKHMEELLKSTNHYGKIIISKKIILMILTYDNVGTDGERSQPFQMRYQAY